MSAHAQGRPGRSECLADVCRTLDFAEMGSLWGGAGAGGRGGGKDLEEALAGREGRAEGREASLLGVTGANTECAHV